MSTAMASTVLSARLASARPAQIAGRRSNTRAVSQSRSAMLLNRRAQVLVRASAADKEGNSLPGAEEKADSLQEISPTTVPEPVARAAPAQSAPGLGELMAFAGPAPETINGRLAMLGIVAALGAELATGQSVVSQLKDTPVAIVLAFITFIAASLIPMVKNTKVKASGPFTPGAELLNGRVAMLGFAALLVTEAIKGSAVL